MKYFRMLLLFGTLLFDVHFTFSQSSPLLIEEGDTLLINKVITESNKVYIAGALRERGYRFTSEQEIKLGKNEYIIVTNLSKKVPGIRICGDELNETNSSSIRDFILSKFAGHKGAGGDGGFGRFLSEYTWYMVEDTLLIPTKYRLDRRHRFFLVTIPGNKRLPPIPFESETNELLLMKDHLFEKNGIHLVPNRIYQFRVEYWSEDESKVITNDFKLKYIPQL